MNSQAQSLGVRSFEEVPAKWNALLDLLDESLRSRPGVGMRVSRLPDATIYTATGRGGGASSLGDFPFKATVSRGEPDGTLKASFKLGTLAGVIPRIGPDPGDLLISDDSAPAYPFEIADAVDGETGIGMLYWEILFNDDYSIRRVYPVASSKKPPPTDYKTWKLIGFLTRDPADPDALPTWRQMLFNNLNHVATQRHGGRAIHRFWAT